MSLFLCVRGQRFFLWKNNLTELVEVKLDEIQLKLLWLLLLSSQDKGGNKSLIRRSINFGDGLILNFYSQSFIMDTLFFRQKELLIYTINTCLDQLPN